MANVYRVSSIDETNYFNTSKEALRCKPYGDEPEEFVRLDAAAECNRLNRMVDQMERSVANMRYLLQELIGVCDPETVAGTDIGRRVQKLIADNPPPPATASDRHSGGGYGV